MNLILGAFFVIRPFCASIAKLAKVQRTKTDYRRRDERLGERAAAHNTDRGKTMHASFNSTTIAGRKAIEPEEVV